MAAELPLLRVGDILDTKPEQCWFGIQRVVTTVRRHPHNHEIDYTFTVTKWIKPADAHAPSTCSHGRYCREIAAGNWKLVTYPDHLRLPLGV